MKMINTIPEGSKGETHSILLHKDGSIYQVWACPLIGYAMKSGDTSFLKVQKPFYLDAGDGTFREFFTWIETDADKIPKGSEVTSNIKSVLAFDV